MNLIALLGVILGVILGALLGLVSVAKADHVSDYQDILKARPCKGVRAINIPASLRGVYQHRSNFERMEQGGPRLYLIENQVLVGAHGIEAIRESMKLIRGKPSQYSTQKTLNDLIGERFCMRQEISGSGGDYQLKLKFLSYAGEGSLNVHTSHVHNFAMSWSGGAAIYNANSHSHSHVPALPFFPAGHGSWGQNYRMVKVRK